MFSFLCATTAHTLCTQNTKYQRFYSGVQVISCQPMKNVHSTTVGVNFYRHRRLLSREVRCLIWPWRRTVPTADSGCQNNHVWANVRSLCRQQLLKCSLRAQGFPPRGPTQWSLEERSGSIWGEDQIFQFCFVSGNTRLKLIKIAFWAVTWILSLTRSLFISHFVNSWCVSAQTQRTGVIVIQMILRVRTCTHAP